MRTLRVFLKGRLPASFNPHQRPDLAKAFVGDPLDQHQVLDAAEGAVFLAVLDNFSRKSISDVRNFPQFFSRCSVDIYGVRERFFRELRSLG